MYYSLMPSLKHMTLVRTTIFLWSEKHGIDLVEKFFLNTANFSCNLNCYCVQDYWPEIENDFILRVQNLAVPELLKTEVLNFIKPIGIEILKWMKFHEEFLPGNFTWESLNKFCWTPQGTINSKKTAEVLIKDENLGVVRRFVLACIYCLEFDIPKLWAQMPSSDKNSMITRYNMNDPVTDINWKILLTLWTTHKSEGCCMCFFAKAGFQVASKVGNRWSTEFFFRELTSGEREESLVPVTEYVATHCFFKKYGFFEVLLFLLSQMHNEKQIEIIKECPAGILKCLLDWPWQSLFMETAISVLEFFSVEYCNYFLNMIVEKVLLGYKDYNYRMLFKEFWQQIPENNKRCIIDNCAIDLLLSKLFQINDNKSVELILKDATILQREKLITSSGGIEMCEILINKREWDKLNFFVYECISSIDTCIKFKEKLHQHLRRKYAEVPFIPYNVWNSFLNLAENLLRK